MQENNICFMEIQITNREWCKIRLDQMVPQLFLKAPEEVLPSDRVGKMVFRQLEQLLEYLDFGFNLSTLGDGICLPTSYFCVDGFESEEVEEYLLSKRFLPRGQIVKKERQITWKFSASVSAPFDSIWNRMQALEKASMELAVEYAQVTTKHFLENDISRVFFAENGLYKAAVLAELYKIKANEEQTIDVCQSEDFVIGFKDCLKSYKQPVLNCVAIQQHNLMKRAFAKALKIAERMDELATNDFFVLYLPDGAYQMVETLLNQAGLKTSFFPVMPASWYITAGLDTFEGTPIYIQR